MTYIAEKVNFEYPRDIYQSSTQAYHLQATCVILHLLAHRELIQQFANIWFTYPLAPPCGKYGIYSCEEILYYNNLSTKDHVANIQKMRK